jgi:large subunit ribosomal protein L21
MTEATTIAKKPVKRAPKATPASRKATQGDVKALYAVFATGGKQYLVQAGDRVKIEKLPGEHAEGDSVTFDHVLLTVNGADINVGSPFISGGKVTGTIKKIARYKTVDVIKYKQKSRYFKKYGHRQPYFEVQVDSIK